MFVFFSEHKWAKSWWNMRPSWLFTMQIIQGLKDGFSLIICNLCSYYAEYRMMPVQGKTGQLGSRDLRGNKYKIKNKLKKKSKKACQKWTLKYSFWMTEFTVLFCVVQMAQGFRANKATISAYSQLLSHNSQRPQNSRALRWFNQIPLPAKFHWIYAASIIITRVNG